jgi:hypothetical protein
MILKLTVAKTSKLRHILFYLKAKSGNTNISRVQTCDTSF